MNMVWPITAWYPELGGMDFIGQLNQVSHSSFYRTKTK
jgi:hypothetical protein